MRESFGANFLERHSATRLRTAFFSSCCLQGTNQTGTKTTSASKAYSVVTMHIDGKLPSLDGSGLIWPQLQRRIVHLGCQPFHTFPA